MKLIVKQFSLTFCHFITVRSQYSPQHPVLKLPPYFYVPLLMSDTKFYAHMEP
jgi:hypothetical protein